MYTLLFNKKFRFHKNNKKFYIKNLIKYYLL